MESEWLAKASCNTPAFKERARAAGAMRDPSEVFFTITESDEGKMFQSGMLPLKYRKRLQRFHKLARRTCSTCPSRLECLFYTLERENYHFHGIAGGLDGANRKALMAMDEPKLHKRECVCGVTLYGVKGKTPEKCSELCGSEDD